MTTTTMTLVEFLTQRIDEDEAAARAAGSAPWEASVPGMVHVSAVARRDNKHAFGGQGFVASVDHGENAHHIARHEPARVLREVEAKRRIVARYSQTLRLVDANADAHAKASRGGIENQIQITALSTHGWELKGRLDGLRYAVDEIASVYDDHPDFREEWRP